MKLLNGATNWSFWWSNVWHRILASDWLVAPMNVGSLSQEQRDEHDIGRTVQMYRRGWRADHGDQRFIAFEIMSWGRSVFWRERRWHCTYRVTRWWFSFHYSSNDNHHPSSLHPSHLLRSVWRRCVLMYFSMRVSVNTLKSITLANESDTEWRRINGQSTNACPSRIQLGKANMHDSLQHVSVTKLCVAAPAAKTTSSLGCWRIRWYRMWCLSSTDGSMNRASRLLWSMRFRRRCCSLAGMTYHWRAPPLWW